MAATGALRQLLPAIGRRLATGQAAFAGGGGRTTMAQGHPADRCVRSYMTEATTSQERNELLTREAARTELALPLALLSLNGASLTLAYYGPYLPRTCNP